MGFHLISNSATNHQKGKQIQPESFHFKKTINPIFRFFHLANFPTKPNGGNSEFEGNTDFSRSTFLPLVMLRVKLSGFLNGLPLDRLMFYRRETESYGRAHTPSVNIFCSVSVVWRLGVLGGCVDKRGSRLFYCINF